MLAAASSALAQVPLASPTENPAELFRDAIASPYGRAMVAEFNAQVSKSADAACLQSKKLTPQLLAQRGEAFLTTWSIRATEKLASFIDMSIYNTTLAKSAGAGAQDELARLGNDPDVKRYLAVERPWWLAASLDYVTEQFSRYVLISRIKMEQISPLATGNQTLVDASEKLEQELDEFLKANTSDAVRRYVELKRQVADALAASLNTEKVRNTFSPTTLFTGAEKELAELCILDGNNPR